MPRLFPDKCKTLTYKQKRKLMDLAVAHRAVEECADYEESPTMQALIKFVDGLLTKRSK